MADLDGHLGAGGLVDVEVEIGDRTPVFGPRLLVHLHVHHAGVEDVGEFGEGDCQLGLSLDLTRRLRLWEEYNIHILTSQSLHTST